LFGQPSRSLLGNSICGGIPGGAWMARQNLSEEGGFADLTRSAEELDEPLRFRQPTFENLSLSSFKHGLTFYSIG